jgi:hypothetical protein
MRIITISLRTAAFTIATSYLIKPFQILIFKLLLLFFFQLFF